MAVKKRTATGVTKAGGSRTTRYEAEKQPVHSPALSPEPVGQTPEVRIHELKVIRIGPEMHAEEFRKAHPEPAESWDQYPGLHLIRFMVKHQMRGTPDVSTENGIANMIRFPEPEAGEPKTYV
jgi:hypothetical protein